MRPSDQDVPTGGRSCGRSPRSVNARRGGRGSSRRGRAGWSSSAPRRTRGRPAWPPIFPHHQAEVDRCGDRPEYRNGSPDADHSPESIQRAIGSASNRRLRGRAGVVPGSIGQVVGLERPGGVEAGSPAPADPERGGGGEGGGGLEAAELEGMPGRSRRGGIAPEPRRRGRSRPRSIAVRLESFERRAGPGGASGPIEPIGDEADLADVGQGLGPGQDRRQVLGPVAGEARVVGVEVESCRGAGSRRGAAGSTDSPMRSGSRPTTDWPRSSNALNQRRSARRLGRHQVGLPPGGEEDGEPAGWAGLGMSLDDRRCAHAGGLVGRRGGGRS